MADRDKKSEEAAKKAEEAAKKAEEAKQKRESLLDKKVVDKKGRDFARPKFFKKDGEV